jgi:poly(A) polymerase
MIKKFIDRLLGKSPAGGRSPLGKRVELAQAEHGIDRALLDANAVKVVQTLKEAGYEAYVVGGAVRDLLLGMRPKDFDVATNATPEQVKGLFRRAFIIGRRFRIVHVVYGRGRDHEVIEVSTFRATLESADAEQISGNEKTSRAELAGKSHVVDAEGRVLRDNVWGPQIEDAARRDFTVNAMYYDPLTEVVVDYHHGVKDGQKRVLRMIGDPATRYREDPVRIVRAVRFAAKLGFEIEPKTRAPIAPMAALLENQPPSRLFDEMIKLLQTGHALRSIAELRKQGLIGKRQGVFPLLDVALGEPRNEQRERLVNLALADTDRRVGEDKPVAPSYLLACMLWHDVQAGWQAHKARGEPALPALQQAVDSVFDSRIGDISGRGKLSADMREIWLMQPRFERRTGNGPFSLVEQPRFRAGFDFLRLRADAGEIEPELAEWWEDFSLGTDEERRALIDLAREQGQGRRGAPRVRSAAASEHAPGPAPTADSSGDAAAPARRKRRRRRKPSGGGGDAPAASAD